jgi:hypothetical protein
MRFCYRNKGRNGSLCLSEIDSKSRFVRGYEKIPIALRGVVYDLAANRIVLLNPVFLSLYLDQHSFDRDFKYSIPYMQRPVRR